MKRMPKKLINFLFVAMLVFCGITAVTLIIGAKNASPLINPDDVTLIQLDTINGKIDDDAEVAIVKTSFGEIRAELYTDLAPKTTARFKELANQGYYDGKYVYEIEQNVYLAAGSPYPDGSLEEGYNEDDERIEQELNKDLWPIRGSFMSSGLSKKEFLSGRDIVYGGSRFLVAGTIDFTDEIKEKLLADKENTKIEDAFIEYGGIPNFSQQITVFAQAYDGFDVIDIISAQESDEKTKRPVEDLKIESIKISTYAEAKKISEK